MELIGLTSYQELLLYFLIQMIVLNIKNNQELISYTDSS